MINNLVLESNFLIFQKQWSTSLCWIRTFLVKIYNNWKKKKTNKNKNPVSWHHLTLMLHSKCDLLGAAKSTITTKQLKSPKMFFADGNLLYSWFKIIVVFMSKNFVTDGKIFYSWSTVLKLPSDVLKNCVSIFIYFYINICFAQSKLTKSVSCFVRIW